MNKKEISKYFSEMAKKRHKKMTKEERSKHGLKMYLGTKRAKQSVHKSDENVAKMG